MEFPGMTMKELSPAGDLQEQPISVKDVDKFFTQLYNYFAQKGLGVIVLTELCSVLSLGFTVSFTTFLMGVVNWSVLSECFDENTCRKVEEELFLNPFHQEPSAYKFIITIYFLLFFSYWVYACHSSVQRVLAAWEMETFYCDHLKIPFNSISDVEWYQVLEKFIDLYDKDQLPFILFPSQKEDTVTSPSDHYHTPLLSTEGQQNQINHKPELTIQQIVCRIMRKENYFIALINKHQLDLYLPWWLSPYTTEQLVLTKTMEWSLYFCLFDEMFVMNNEGNYIIRESFFSDVNGLQHRFQMIGLIMFLLIPFMTIFMILHFFLENASYFHSTKAYLGPRQWTPFALWQFREFNELKHFFDERMNAAYIPATEYLLSFRNPYIIVLARLVSYIAGGIVATILFVSIFHSEALVHITVSEHNLLWYLGISSALFATSRSMLPDETKKSELPAVLLEKMRCHTHQDGLNWLGKEHTTVVRNEISDLLVFKIQLFLTEISGVWLTPLILCFSLPRCVPTLLEFLRTHSEYKEHIGTVCDYCSFDIAKHGDPTYGSITETDRENAPTRMQDNHSSGIPNNGAPSQIRSAAPSSTANNINKIRLNDGKLEKSVVSFMHHYPTAQLDPRALTFLDRMDTYKSMMKTRREREVSSMIFEKSIFPVGTGSVGRASVTLNSEAGDRDRVILPPAPSHSTEEIIHEKDNVHGIAMTSPPALAFPAVGEDKSFGNSSPVRDLVSSDYYPYEDSATFNNTKANRGLINTQPPSIPPPPYAGQKVSNEKLPVIREQIISRDEMGIGEGNGAVGMSGGQAGVSILKSPNYSHYPGSRMILSSRGQTPRRNPSSSLFGVGSRFHRQQIGRGREQNSEEMPSVLLSLLQRQNIDYQNDFYWLEKFHRDKVLHKEELDKSLLDYQLQQQNISHLHSQQNSFFPFAMPGGSTSRWPSSFPHEPVPPPSLNQAFDHNSTAGMYAENINRNIISSPKPSAAYRKSANSGNSLKSTSNPQMLGAAANSSGSGDNIATVTSGGGYFPFETSRVNSVDENDQSFSPVVQEHYTNSLTPQKPTHAQNKDT